MKATEEQMMGMGQDRGKGNGSLGTARLPQPLALLPGRLLFCHPKSAAFKIVSCNDVRRADWLVFWLWCLRGLRTGALLLFLGGAALSSPVSGLATIVALALAASFLSVGCSCR
jgi:hypothetical protein